MRTWTLLFIAVQVALLGVLYQRYGISYFGIGCGFEEASELLIHSERVVTELQVLPAALHIKDGKIHEVIPLSEKARLEKLGDLKVIDYGNLVISPGGIDTHVHFNEPGLDQREGIASGTRSAAAGGVTTVVDMPVVCSPATDSCSRLKSKIFRFKRDSFCNIGAWAGVSPVNAKNEEELKCMVQVAGALGFHSVIGSIQGKLLPVNVTHIETAIPIATKLNIPYSIRISANDDPKISSTEEEQKIVKEIISFLEESRDELASAGFRIHFTNIASAESVADIHTARESGLPVSVELAPHYLHFAQEDAKTNTLLKVNPPLMSKENRDALLEGVKSGAVDTIASVHTPSMPSEKLTSFKDALHGITSIQYTLPVVWTHISPKQTSHSDLLLLKDLLSAHPAQLLNLDSYKGAIAAGFDADLVVWDPDGAADTSKQGCRMQHPKLCPYLGQSFKGSVKTTWLKGNLVFDASRGLSWSSCRKVYGLGEWAKCIVLWFIEISYVE